MTPVSDPTDVITLLLSKQVACDDLSWKMTQSLRGDGSANELVMMQIIAQLDAETTLLEARISALASGGAFTAPTEQEKNTLFQAILRARAAIAGSAAVNEMLGAATDLLSAYGGARSMPQ